MSALEQSAPQVSLPASQNTAKGAGTRPGDRSPSQHRVDAYFERAEVDDPYGAEESPDATQLYLKEIGHAPLLTAAISFRCAKSAADPATKSEAP